MKRSRILNKIGLIFVVCQLISLSPQKAGATTYYSDFNTGVDTNNGTTTSTPWKYMPGMSGWTGSATLSSGDVVVLKGGSHWTFTSTSANLITPPATITIMGGQQCGFTGSPAVVCNGTTTPCGSDASVSCNGGAPWGSGYPIIDGQGNSTASRSGVYLFPNLKGYGLTIDGIELYNIGDYQNVSYGLQVTGSNITIKNCLFAPYSLDGIAMQNTASNTTINNILIHDNTFEAMGRCEIDGGTGSTASAIINNLQIYNNTYYGPNTNGAVYTNATFHGDGFMMSGNNTDTYGLTNVVIHHNKFIGDWCANNGTANDSVTAVIYITGSTSQYSDNGTLIYDNLFEDDTATCTNGSGTQEPPWAWGAVAIGHGYHTGAQIYNNTIYGFSTTGESAIQISDVNGATATIENNILAKCDNCILLDSSVVGTITMNYNQFWSLNGNDLIYDQRTSVNKRCNTCSVCLTQESGSGMTYCNDSYSAGNNLFVTLPTQGTAGSGNFNLLSGSPAIGQGANLSSIFTTDIQGNPWTVPWGIGAYEYVSTSYMLSVTSGTGSPTITSSPSGVSGNTACSVSFTSGTLVTLSATCSSGYQNPVYSGDCTGSACSVTMNAAKSVSVNCSATNSGGGSSGGGGGGAFGFIPILMALAICGLAWRRK
ncbi:MAG TPA: choice-of-anchor Q domain-containing protein [Smithella sp.]|nr:choice-of-anchor Q domain-containing protein [Smithella sp.]